MKYRSYNVDLGESTPRQYRGETRYIFAYTTGHIAHADMTTFAVLSRSNLMGCEMYGDDLNGQGAPWGYHGAH